MKSKAQKVLALFKNMRKKDITKNGLLFKDSKKHQYCLCGLTEKVIPFNIDDEAQIDVIDRALGSGVAHNLIEIHSMYANGDVTFSQMKKDAIAYMEAIV